MPMWFCSIALHLGGGQGAARVCFGGHVGFTVFFCFRRFELFKFRVQGFGLAFRSSFEFGVSGRADARLLLSWHPFCGVSYRVARQGSEDPKIKMLPSRGLRL